MSKPATRTYYVLNAHAAGVHYTTSVNPPALSFANNSSGWIVSNVTPPRYGLMDFQTEKAVATMGSSHTASNSPITAAGAGDCFVIGPIHGLFEAGLWGINKCIKGNTQGGEADGRFLFRVYTGSVANGTGAGLLTPTFFTSSDYTNLTTTTHQHISCSASLPVISCQAKKFIFFQTQLWTTGAGGGTTRDVNFYFGPSTASRVTTTQFLDHQFQFSQTQIFNDDDGI